MVSTQRIDATITRVEHYALYVHTSQGDAIILIPDVSTERIHDLKMQYSIGDIVQVRLLCFVEDESLYKATMLPAPRAPRGPATSRAAIAPLLAPTPARTQRG